jgi:hypothetical protein
MKTGRAAPRTNRPPPPVSNTLHAKGGATAGSKPQHNVLKDLFESGVRRFAELLGGHSVALPKDGGHATLKGNNTTKVG